MNILLLTSTIFNHIKILHEGVKFGCNQCESTFDRHSDRMAHIKAIHEGLKYDCNQCDYRANQQSNLTTHIRYTLPEK